MKYIRAENGIYEILDETEDGYWSIYGDYFRKTFDNKPADTIEELCDCFVTVGNRHIVWDKQQNKGITFEQVKNGFTSNHFKIYGAIWTDGGLKYVAKMNEEGELELL